MYDGSQVQDDGRTDATVEENSRGEAVDRDDRLEISYWCNRCSSSIGPRKKNPERYISHEDHIKKCWINGTAGVDYVECAICKFAGRKITQHVKLSHDLSKNDYELMYGPTTCEESSKEYGKTGNCNWIERKKSAGEDLTSYKKKMGRSVSSSIMSNPEERSRRAMLLGELNKRQDFRDRSSAIAKVTSSREDIIEKRTEQLRRWRRDCPEEFQAAIEKALKTNSSRPEKILFEICKGVFGEKTSKQLQVQHHLIPTKSHRARIDIANKELKILVEFDGPFHFKPILGEEHLKLRIQRDFAVEQYAVENGYVLVRISYDLFDGKTFDKKVVESLKLALGMSCCIIRIGKFYSSENNQEVMI